MAKDYNPSQRNREAFEALTDTAGNVPPQAVELEEAVLGALMLEKDSIIAVQEYVTPDAFYTEEHRTIYRAIEELSMELKPIDLYTVTERLKAKKELKKVGGASYLAQLTQKVGSAANVEFHAKIIAQKYVQRELIRSATEIQKRSYDESTDVTELIGYAEGEIFKVAEGHVKRSVQASKDILARALMQIEEASKNTSAFNGVPSGFMAIDRVTLGWQLSDLIIVAARAEENIYYEHQARHDQNRVGDVEHREEVRSLTRRSQHCGGTALKLGYLSGNGVVRGVLKAGVEVSAGFKVEQLAHVLTGGVLEGGALDYRHLPRFAVSGSVASLDAFGSHF